jgi:ABC-type sugar transport system permease subunit
MGKIIGTLLGVLVAVGASTALWVGANLVFDQSTQNWRRFSGLVGGIVGFLSFAVLDGNRLLQVLGPRQRVADVAESVANAVPALTTAVIVAVIGWFVAAPLAAYYARPNLERIAPVVGAVIGLVIGVVAVERIPADTVVTFLWWPMIGAVLFGVFAIALSAIEDPWPRLAVGVGGGAGIGLLVGVTLMSRYEPALRSVPLMAWPLGAAAAGALINLARRRNPVTLALVGGLVGWMIAAWGIPDLGPGTRAEAVLAATVPGALIGARLGLTRNPAWYGRTLIDQKSRGAIFLVPALSFIGITLVIPTIRTIYLSLLDRGSTEWVGLENYRTIFTSDSSFDVSAWRNIFTSQLFLGAVVLLAIGLLIASAQGRRTGTRVDASGPATGPMALAAVLLAFAVFTSLRGTIVNNLWWVFSVTLLSTSFGLLIAVLADRGRWESVAKSLIFMPMAISFVGASIIWRFMYLPRDTSQDQTGVLNALWVWLGEISNSSARWAFVAVLVLLIAGLAWLAVDGARRGRSGSAVTAGIVALPLAWLAYRFAGPGLGGFVTLPDGTIAPDTVLFIQQPPWNNFWLMVVLIWIQTGFAMVILSAAIKAVPGEYIEAAQVDGATENQTFWRIIIPQIAPTIGVVVTTLIVLVMKVFDIVKVMTNGNFDTQVIANEMFNEAFQRTNYGLGAALAVVLFLSVLPVMYLNIRRMQQAQAQ